MLCLCQYGHALLGFWFQTDLGRRNSASFFKVQAGKTFSFYGHALVTLNVQFLYSDWSKFDRWVHAGNLWSILKVVTLTAEADRVLCQLVMFLTVFFLQMYKIKYSCYHESSVIHGWFVCLLKFGCRKKTLSDFLASRSSPWVCLNVTGRNSRVEVAGAGKCRG